MDNKGSVIKDEELIKALTKGLDLSKARDIEVVYRSLQSGVYVFQSEVGRDFDDHIFELMEKVKSGEITDEPVDSKTKKSSKKKVTKKESTVKKDNPGKVIKKSDDIKDKRISKKKNNDEKIDILVALELKKREKKRRLLIALASVVAVASLGYFVIYYYMSARTSSDYEDLANLKGSDLLNEGATNDHEFKLSKKGIVVPDILDEYKTLYAKNNKLAGWLKIDGTKIDYPVMQTTDNEYYLNHNYNQEKDNNGSLFLDCECCLYPRSTNMIIYGHHMKSGNMFGNLQQYVKESYWEKHKTIQFDTIYEKATYEVMYAFYSKVYDNDELVFKYYQFIDANSEKEFDYYMDEMRKLSLYDTGVKASYGDSLLTLSTCDHSQTDGRFAVVARRID